MTHAPVAPPLGQLLVRSEIIGPQALQAALERAQQSGLKIGQVLMFSGLINERLLKAALQAQRMVRSRTLPLPHAVAALEAAKKYNIDFSTALAKLRWALGHEQIHQVARLLVESKLVDTEQLGYALSLAVRSQLPLGRIMVLHEMICGRTRRMVLDAVIMIRCGEISFEHALAALKAADRRNLPFHALVGHDVSPVSVLTHEFRKSGIFTEVEVTDVIEETLMRESLWDGNVLSDNLLANLKFAASLALKRLLASGEVTPEQAKQIGNDLLLTTNDVVASIPDATPLVMIA